MKSRTLFIFVVSGLALSFWIYNIIKLTEFGKKVEEIGVNNLDCHKLDYRNPIEDFVKINETFIIGSSFDVLHLFHDMDYLDPNKKVPNGAMVAYDLNTNKLYEIKINNFPKDIPFHPHGIDLFQDIYLFVINHSFSHTNSQERIELLSINFSNNKVITLDYIKTFLLPQNHFGTSNALTAISLSTFYVSSSYPFPMPLNSKEDSFFRRAKYKYGPALSIIFNLKLCGTYLYNEGKLTLIKETKGIMNNGIVYDEDRNLIYVSQTVDKKFMIFDISKDFKKPKSIKTVISNYAFDNLFLDKKNKKIYACIIGSLLEHQSVVNSYLKYKDLNHVDKFYGGYEVIDITNNDKVEIIHLSNKKLIGISSGMDIGNKQILSACFENGLLVCKKH